MNTTAPTFAARPGNAQPRRVRIKHRGWTVVVDKTEGTVTVPPQALSADIYVEDLAACLAQARSHLRPHQPAPDGDAPPPPTVDDIANALRAGRAIATDHWHPYRYDIYDCTRRAWEEADMTMPYSFLLNALRAVLPAGVTLADFNDEVGLNGITRLYTNAANRLVTPAGGAVQGAA